MLTWHLLDTFLAVVPKDQDILAQIQAAWNDLINSGKLGVGLFGFVLGFLLKGIDS